MKRAKLNNDKITALYCRLSKDDGTNNESMSISTQRYKLRPPRFPTAYRGHTGRGSVNAHHKRPVTFGEELP